MFNSGVFNELVKGYMAKALERSNMKCDVILEQLKHLENVLSEEIASEIRKFIENY